MLAASGGAASAFDEGAAIATTEQSPRFQFNDARLRSFRGKGRLIAFICEEQSCHAAVLLSAEEYEARRPGLILCDAHGTASSTSEAT